MGNVWNSNDYTPLYTMNPLKRTSDAVLKDFDRKGIMGSLSIKGSWSDSRYAAHLWRMVRNRSGYEKVFEKRQIWSPPAATS